MNTRARSIRPPRRKRASASVLIEARARLARNVRRLRVQAGLSQEMLAVDAQLQTAHVSKIELSLANPTVNVLARLARALGADLGDLWLRFGEQERSPLPNLRRGRKPKALKP